MITSGWADVLRCSGCGSPYEVGEEALVCPRCATRFPVVDGIPLLLEETTTGTTLENIDYDAVHGVNEQLVAKIGSQWKEIIERLGPRPEHALEIGAGTGVLSMGLLQEKAVERLTATDVSHKFLRILADRIAAYSTPVSLVACDANEPHFRPEAFDLVVGRSVLHHLLDYDATLRQSCAMLAPGGAAVFFEPVLEGKAIVALLFALVLACDEKTNGGRLSFDDRDKIRRYIHRQTRSKRDPQDRRTLSRLEDKYIFEIDQMKKTGREAGFAEVEFFGYEVVEPTYWPYLAQMCRNNGIPPAKIQPYRWIGEQFADTFGLMLSNQLVTPMGYFVFRKSRDGTTQGGTRMTDGSAEPSREHSSRGRAALTRVVIGLTRTGISLRGARELRVQDRKSGTRQRALVFVVSSDGGRYLVAPNAKARWVRNLRAARGGELRVGRRSEHFRATEVADDLEPVIARRWLRQVRLLGIDGADADAPVFRIDPA